MDWFITSSKHSFGNFLYSLPSSLSLVVRSYKSRTFLLHFIRESKEGVLSYLLRLGRRPFKLNFINMTNCTIKIKNLYWIPLRNFTSIFRHIFYKWYCNKYHCLLTSVRFTFGIPLPIYLISYMCITSQYVDNLY